jgi:hypothetical protein
MVPCGPPGMPAGLEVDAMSLTRQIASFSRATSPGSRCKQALSCQSGGTFCCGKGESGMMGVVVGGGGAWVV